jgi:drug/metabolite transporter (DMT)-like permease
MAMLWGPEAGFPGLASRAEGFELVVAAVAAYLLAPEVMRPRDWTGGMLIVAASFTSAGLERRPAAA